MGHVPTSLVGTYAYVNPCVAVLVGWLVAGETITLGIIGGMLIILLGVALVRSAGARTERGGPSGVLGLTAIRLAAPDGQAATCQPFRAGSRAEAPSTSEFP
jgi:hypothetical protein